MARFFRRARRVVVFLTICSIIWVVGTFVLRSFESTPAGQIVLQGAESFLEQKLAELEYRRDVAMMAATAAK